MRLDSIASSALSAFGVDMMARANNIANVNTREFQSQAVTLQTGPRGEGVAVGAISRDTAPGPLVPGLITDNADGRTVLRPGYVEGSNTDVAREFTGMIATHRGYDANAAVVRAYEDLSGTVLDLKV